MRVPIEATDGEGWELDSQPDHHPLKMRVPIEARSCARQRIRNRHHHPLKMRVPIEACSAQSYMATPGPSPSENEGPY